MIRFLSILLLPALLSCTPQAGLDTSGRGAPAPLVYAPEGTLIRLSNTVNGQVSESRITAGRALGPQGALIRSNGTQGSFYPGCWDCGGGMQIEEALYTALWPLETGKIASFIRTAQDGNKARVVIRVAGREQVETPAGSFDTYLLEGRVQHLTGPQYEANVRAWWASDPGWVVKAQGSDSAGTSLASEVVEFIDP
ncbi:MAG: hypothetical protein AB8B85_20245 [Paracoccaceae bacterium]